ncbi:hypothetical protein BLNAU_11432 [Blattamonas nauphoetae]|uniref:RING-type domain-containing protein n=1 Tax=Blattamonas nauphoetae TaxID=2049346 RepID=A0ABQ9XQG0_9EUKA|nr:hypothetical protein BLNAU_11432 [Blattamonas nauphoetae]
MLYLAARPHPHKYFHESTINPQAPPFIPNATFRQTHRIGPATEPFRPSSIPWERRVSPEIGEDSDWNERPPRILPAWARLGVRRINPEILPEEIEATFEGIVSSLFRKETATADASTSDLTCVICQWDYEEPERLMQLDCGHMFHWDCCVDWIKKFPTCPICRIDLRKKNNYEHQKVVLRLNRRFHELLTPQIRAVSDDDDDLFEISDSDDDDEDQFESLDHSDHPDDELMNFVDDDDQNLFEIPDSDDDDDQPESLDHSDHPDDERMDSVDDDDQNPFSDDDDDERILFQDDGSPEPNRRLVAVPSPSSFTVDDSFFDTYAQNESWPWEKGPTDAPFLCD